MNKRQCFFIAYGLILLFSGPILAGISYPFVFKKSNPSGTSVKFYQEAPLARFSFASDGECSDVAVNFTNGSTGEKLTYEWDFGDPDSDKNTSTQADPSHVFVGSPGNEKHSFTVTLKVTDETGITDEITKSITRKQIPSLTVGSDKDSNTFDNLPFYIVCENTTSNFTFYNHSTTKATSVKYEIDWGDGTAKFQATDWESLSHSYSQGIYNLQYTITGESGCVATKTYGIFIGSNPAVGLGNPGNTNICSETALSFPITSTENNPVGTIYTVTFSDGSDPQPFTHPPPATVEHVFKESSCGEYNTSGYPNSFSATITAANPCATSTAMVSPIYVTKAPEPEMEVPDEAVCLNSPALITNSTLYSNEVNPSGNCSDQGKFTWEISPATGWTLSSGSLGDRPDPNSPNSWQLGSKNIQPVFSEPGTYTITLYTGNRCGLGEVQETICVIPEPEPSFTLDEVEGCGPLEVKAINKSNLLGLCGEGEMSWSVSYSQGSCGTESDWGFVPGSDKNSRDPVFLFNNPGEYTILLALTASCGTFETSEKVTVYAPPTAEIAPIADVCGAAAIEPKATVNACGTGEATYQWTFEGGVPKTSNSLVPGSVEFSTPGKKNISLEVTTSCGAIKTTQTFTVNEFPLVDAGEDMEICNGEEVTLAPTVQPAGDYAYEWISSADGNRFGIENPLVKPNQTTTYTLTVTDRKTGCVQMDEITVTVLPAPVIEFSLPDQVICSGETSQPVSTSPLPPGATIAWTSQANGVEGVTSSGKSQIPAQTLINKGITPLQVIYTAEITATDHGKCAVVPATYTITVNPAPHYADEKVEICSGEVLDFTPKNHISGSRYSWTVNPLSTVSGSLDQVNSQNSLIQTLVNNGDVPAKVIYTLTPYLGDCPGEPFTLTVTVQPSPGIDFSIPDQVICTAGTTQEVKITTEVKGAAISWVARANGVDGVLSSGTDRIPFQTLTNPTRQPIVVEYEVLAATQAGAGCEGVPQRYTITVNPSIQAESLLSDFSGYGISCHGAGDGSIQLTPSGGDGNYQFSWQGPDGFQSTVQHLQNLVPGIYLVAINDGTGCEFSQTYELLEPEPLTVALASKEDVLCAGESTGSMQLTVGGGVENQDYQYNWTRNGAPYPATAQNINKAPAGTYQVTISDQNGCTLTSADLIITEPERPLTLGVQKRDISCYNANDGFIELEVTGGQAPYSILWDFGSSQTSFENMGPGTYTVTVRDKVGCSTVMPVEIADAPLFQITPAVKNISCHGKQDGSIELNLEGKGPETTIRWDHGAEVESLFNLDAGAYGVTLTDPRGCTIRQGFSIMEPSLLVLESQITDALDCENPQSGAINLAVSGGTPPFTFRWSNGAVEQNLTQLSAGTYAVEVEDASGCTVAGQLLVKRPEPLTIIAFRSTEVTCEPREVVEEIRIAVSGGVAPYTINWSAGVISSNGKVMTTNQPGLYLLEVTDGNGCNSRESFEIKETEVLVDMEYQSAAFDLYQAYMVYMEIQFVNNSIGTISSYFWNFGDGNTSLEKNPKHAYLLEGEHEISLTVTDVHGCEIQKKKKIKVVDYYLVVPNAFTPNSDGVNDYFFPKFLNIEKLEFWVLTKWGETIYHTDDLQSRGWDGSVRGEPAMPGNYVYRLSFQTFDGRKQTQTDVFLLFK